MDKNQIIFHREEMVVKDNTHIIRVMYRDIESIVCKAPYLRIVCIDRKERFIYYSLEELIKELPATFVLCNRSVVINLMHVDSMQCKILKYFFVMKTGEQISVARRKKKEIKEKWKNVDRSSTKMDRSPTLPEKLLHELIKK